MKICSTLIRAAFSVCVLAVILSLCSCGLFRVRSTFDSAAISDDAMARLEIESNQFLAEMLSQDKIVDQADCRYEVVTSVICRVYNILAEKNVERDYIKVVIVETPQHLCISVPPGYIILSTGTIDEARKIDCKGLSALTGLISHEIAHINLSHTRILWALQAIRDKATTQALLHLLSAIPMIASPIKIDYEIPANSHRFKYAQWYLECVADLYALQVLEGLQLDPKCYLKYFEQLATVIQVGDASNDRYVTTKNRSERIAAYLARPTWTNNCNLSSLFLVKNELGGEFYLHRLRDFASICDFALTDEGRMSLDARSVSYWIAASSQNSEWVHEFLFVRNMTMQGLDGSAIKDSHGYVISHSMYSVPYRLFGLNSYLLPNVKLTFNINGMK